MHNGGVAEYAPRHRNGMIVTQQVKGHRARPAAGARLPADARLVGPLPPARREMTTPLRDALSGSASTAEASTSAGLISSPRKSRLRPSNSSSLGQDKWSGRLTADCRLRLRRLFQHGPARRSSVSGWISRKITSALLLSLPTGILSTAIGSLVAGCILGGPSWVITHLRGERNHDR